MKDEKLYVAFMDLEKAYNRVEWEAICIVLKNMMLEGSYWGELNIL